MAIIGIYKITSPSNRIYIGQSISIEKRFKRYKIGKCYKQIRLYNSFKKYSVEKHKFEILELCDMSELNKRERFYQDKYNVTGLGGLNIALQGTNDKSGVMSEETKLKVSIANTGKKRTKEQNIAMSKLRQGVPISGKLLLDTQTGIFYNSVADACKSYKYKYGTLRSFLNGQAKNKSNLINI